MAKKSQSSIYGKYYTTRPKVFARRVKSLKNRKHVVAYGDSWFAYPAIAKARNVIIHLSKMKKKLNILQISKCGAEAVEMLSGKRKIKTLKIINRSKVDFLLFSGGGNDIVGAFDFEFFLKNDVVSDHWRDYLYQGRLDRRIAQIENAYRDLIGFCRDYSANKKIKIITHCYDYPIPDPKGAVIDIGLFDFEIGQSWMYPYLMKKKVPKEFHKSIVHYLIDRLGDNLQKLNEENSDIFYVAETRGLLKKNEWLNEIHPTTAGAKKVAKKIYAKMEETM